MKKNNSDLYYQWKKETGLNMFDGSGKTFNIYKEWLEKKISALEKENKELKAEYNYKISKLITDNAKQIKELKKTHISIEDVKKIMKDEIDYQKQMYKKGDMCSQYVFHRLEQLTKEINKLSQKGK